MDFRQLEYEVVICVKQFFNRPKRRKNVMLYIKRIFTWEYGKNKNNNKFYIPYFSFL